MTSDPPSQTRLSSLPHALEAFEDLVRELGPKPPALFLDYDGTLTRIAERPEQAKLATPVRETLSRLAGLIPLGIISGRDLDDVQNLVRVENIIYAGSHGFDIHVPGQGRIQPHPPSPALTQAAEELEAGVQAVPGIIVERKRFSLAVHYRQASAEGEDHTRRMVARILEGFPDLHRLEGKKVIEIQPKLEWDKGRAVLHILDIISRQGEGHAVPVYIGDDTTDETAFSALFHLGTGICVGREEHRLTAARYRLDDSGEVHIFLQRFCAHLETSAPG